MEQKMRDPLVSIIMASYNADKTISAAIKSVIAQTYTNWELLVVNDCSTDNTLVVSETFDDPRIRIINNVNNLGVSETRAEGLAEARGDWIAILDSDDKWRPEKLQKQIDLIRKTNAELVYTGSGFMNENGIIRDWVLHVPPFLTFKRLLKQNLISNSSALVKKELYRRFYAYGDNMHEDYAIWLGITKSGIKAYGIDEPLLIYRISKSSKSSSKIKAAKMNWNTYRYVGLSLTTSFYYMCWYTINGLIKKVFRRKCSIVFGYDERFSAPSPDKLNHAYDKYIHSFFQFILANDCVSSPMPPCF